MKKKWLISSGVITLISGGFVLSKKFFKKNVPTKEIQKKEMTEIFEEMGYQVHCYNEHNDFVLFHTKNNEKKHLLYDDGTIEEEALFEKLNAYYHHFTNVFYFVSKDEETLTNSTKNKFKNWIIKYFSDENGINLNMVVHFTTHSKILTKENDIWETIKF